MRGWLLATLVAFAAHGGAWGAGVWYLLPSTTSTTPYERCAEDFERDTGIRVTLESVAEGATYRTILTERLAAGRGPDAFVVDVAELPQWVERGYLLDLTDHAEALVDLDSSVAGLADTYLVDGRRYALAKDWHAIALVYRSDALLAAGISVAELENAAWNPDDGGDLLTLIARLTRDGEGRDGTDPAFDPRNVERYGFAIGVPDWSGWGWLAGANGFSFGADDRLDDPRLIATLAWWANGLIARGFAPAFEGGGGIDPLALFRAGRVALIADGSWAIAAHAASPFGVGFSRLPLGPVGRASLLRSRGDAVNAASPHATEAIAWVTYLASAACQDHVGAVGGAFPAQRSAAVEAWERLRDEGIDATAFVRPALDQDVTVPAAQDPDQAAVDAILAEVIGALGMRLGDAGTLLRHAQELIEAHRTRR
jgi:multiple sugar transport system substrate-binding protein